MTNSSASVGTAEDGLTVGFVGLGAMGRAMAERIAKSGNSLPCHRIKDVSEGLLEVGTRPTAAPAEVAGGAESTILVPRDTPDVDGGADEPSGPAVALKLRRDLKMMDAARSLEFALPNTAAAVELMNATMARALGERDRSGGCHGR